MPIYSFVCKACPEADGQPSPFDLSMAMADDRSKVACPACKFTDNVAREFGTPLITAGLTAFEKSAGTTKHRFELGKFMKDERGKRKKAHEPGTLLHDSNELWAGNHLPTGVKPPEPK